MYINTFIQTFIVTEHAQNMPKRGQQTMYLGKVNEAEVVLSCSWVQSQKPKSNVNNGWTFSLTVYQLYCSFHDNVFNNNYLIIPSVFF